MLTEERKEIAKGILASIVVVSAVAAIVNDANLYFSRFRWVGTMMQTLLLYFYYFPRINGTNAIMGYGIINKETPEGMKAFADFIAAIWFVACIPFMFRN